MNLNNSDIEFGDWNIDVNDNIGPGLKEPWSGSLEIKKSDYFNKVYNSVGKQIQIIADFVGDKNYSGIIEIIGDSINHHFDDPMTIKFRGNNELKVIPLENVRRSGR